MEDGQLFATRSYRPLGPGPPSLPSLADDGVGLVAIYERPNVV